MSVNEIDMFPPICLCREQTSWIASQRDVMLVKQFAQHSHDAGGRKEQSLLLYDISDLRVALCHHCLSYIGFQVVSGLVVVNEHLCQGVELFPPLLAVEEGIVDSVRIGGDGISRPVDGCAVEFHPALKHVISVEKSPQFRPGLIANDELLQYVEHGQTLVGIVEIEDESIVVEPATAPLQEEVISHHLRMLLYDIHHVFHGFFHFHEMIHRGSPHVVENHDFVVVIVKEISQEDGEGNLCEGVGDDSVCPLP